MGVVVALRRRKRRFSRVAIEQPVALVHANGTVATTLGYNLSQGGMQVRCDRYTADSLYPSRMGPGRPRRVRIDAHFKLPLGSGLVKLDVECRLVYVNALPDGWYALGLEFVRFHYAGAAVVEKFLREAEALA